MEDVIELLVPWAVTTCAIFALVRWDERRLSPQRLALAWPTTSKASAIVTFGFLAVPVHFWRTRRSWAGLGVGMLWGLAVAGLQIGVASAIEWVCYGSNPS
jgi:hypothetical protein